METDCVENNYLVKENNDEELFVIKQFKNILICISYNIYYKCFNLESRNIEDLPDYYISDRDWMEEELKEWAK